MKKILFKVGEQIVFYSSLMSGKIRATIIDIFWKSPNGETLYYIEEPSNPPSDLIVEIEVFARDSDSQFQLKQRTTALDLRKALSRQVARN